VRSLAALRKAPIDHPVVGLDAALVALSGRIRLREGSARSSEDIVREIWLDVFGREVDEHDAGKVRPPTGVPASRM
jgi:MoxR-like ATPase